MSRQDRKEPLSFAHPAVRAWFDESFEGPTLAQAKAWPPIVEGRSTLVLAPTGSGKTLAAFLAAIHRLMFSPEPERRERCRVLYISPLKALGVDIERNLRTPITGIAGIAERDGHAFRLPAVAVRTGDTPQEDRARMSRTPPDILITTPESLYLILTSNARTILRSVETVIVDEIHAMAGSKRGAHLFLSLERLEALRRKASAAAPLQRIGLSATQRPLDEMARLLGGGTAGPTEASPWRPRPVEIVDAGAMKKALEIVVEVPVEDMGRLGKTRDEIASGPSARGGVNRSIWPSIHPRIVELIRGHRSTIVFVNNRRLAERLAAAVNERAGEELAAAHHGSIAKEKRREIEDRLKRGDLPAIIATSSLELGIDMGAVDLVIQVETPPSVASGLQRIGRASHSVGATSRGVVFPKYRGDLLASAAAVRRILERKVEETFYPRNPLDVLAQQVVAMVSVEPSTVEELYATVRGAAPFADLSRGLFEGVLDMLSGRYPSDEFAELRPRITWDRATGRVEARRGAKRIAVVNGGTIPDRGLYGVFLIGKSDEGGSRRHGPPGSKRGSRRVGELDEEMVFETRVGDVFLLGASSWRVEEITHDRVLVSPAPGAPGRMPFWHGDRPGRPVELGRAIGALARKLAKEAPDKASVELHREYGLDALAVKNLLAYIHEQIEAAGEVPSDRTILFERFVDEIGDWRVCVLTPFGARIHAPWATGVAARLRGEVDTEVDVMWTDDGIVFRLPGAGSPPPVDVFFPSPDEAEDLVLGSLGGTSLFAGHFRENAARALLLPRRHPGRRAPLWAQRRRSASLLKTAAQYRDFPIVLETYRECMRDVFDLPGLVDILRQVRSRTIRVATVDSRSPSPFAASLLFEYVSHFMYEGDAPLAERRAQVLAIDHARLKEILGEAELRELFDVELIEALEARLQRRDERYRLRHADALHDGLLALGDLGRREIGERGVDGADVGAWISDLTAARRIVEVPVGGVRRLIAAEDVGRYRDALGVVPPPGIPDAFLEPSGDALGQLVARYARTHAPFTTEAAAERFGIPVAVAHAALERLARADRILEGEFLPGGRGREWCDPEVLRILKQQSFAKLRREIEPVEPVVLARFLPVWQAADRPRPGGLDALLNAIERLQGAAIPASVLEASVLPARTKDYAPHMLDELCAAGEIVWRGTEPLGPSNGRIALYLTDDYARLAPDGGESGGELASRLRDLFRQRGALFFSDLVSMTGAFPGDLAAALWDLVWAGEVTNDTLAPVRSMLAASGSRGRNGHRRHRAFRSRRIGPPGTEGRWSLLSKPQEGGVSPTERRTALATQLLERHGVLTREAVQAEGIEGGYSAVYPVLKAMEEAGRIRRGYFVAGLGATQFALPGSDDRLRQFRETGDEAVEPLVLASTDPANAYGAALPWPPREGARPQRSAGSLVILFGGDLIAYLGTTERSLLTFLPSEEPARTHAARSLSRALAERVEGEGCRAILIGTIDGEDPNRSFLAPFLAAVGFRLQSRGFLKRRTDPID